MNRPLTTILIGTDLGDASDAAVGAGTALARLHRRQVHLLHVWTPPPAFAGVTDAAAVVTDEVLEQERQARKRRLEEQIDRLGLGPEEVASARLEVGSAHRAIPEVAAELDAGLIVLGASESAGRLAWVLGSTADRVLRKATCPVLVVRGDLRLPPRRVLVAVDLSPQSREAVRSAASLFGGREEGGSETEALYVLPEGQLAAAEAEVSEERLLAAAGREVLHFVRESGGEALAARPKVRIGQATREILIEGADWGPDLIVMGTHGAGGFERLLLGSVASAVTRSAACSVLVVPPPAAVGEGPAAIAV